MVFSDLFFLFVFLPAFILLYSLANVIDRRISLHREHPVHVLRNVMLVIFSLIFYSWGEPVYVLLMVFSVLINYIAGRVMERGGQARRMGLIFGLVCDLAILGSFKYLGFFAGILNSVGIPVDVPHIGLPIGISFYIFQSISYLVDVYRAESHAQRRFTDLLLYISMFPQLIAGPIVRYNSVADEINNRRVSASDIYDGVFRFMIGLGKKVILANQFAPIVDQFLGGDLTQLSTPGAWVGIVAFTFQIYFDFSGYSDMAIGIGRCLGFHFDENFNHPYCSRSITEFWRRWHMTLGGFFRDYVYIPLGGNRRRQWFNILVVWCLTGLWHGASWNFVIWGLYFGLIVAVEKFTILRWHIPAPILYAYSLLLVVIGWGIFYFDSLDAMGRFFNALFGGGQPGDFKVTSALFDNFWLWITAILFCMPVRRVAADTAERVTGAGSGMSHTVVLISRLAVAAAILLISVALLVGGTLNPFLYTRF